MLERLYFLILSVEWRLVGCWHVEIDEVGGVRGNRAPTCNGSASATGGCLIELPAGLSPYPREHPREQCPIPSRSVRITIEHIGHKEPAGASTICWKYMSTNA
jgi:hypothetical protein